MLPVQESEAYYYENLSETLTDYPYSAVISTDNLGLFSRQIIDPGQEELKMMIKFRSVQYISSRILYTPVFVLWTEKRFSTGAVRYSLILSLSAL